MNKKVRVRFAPSPTGGLHLGGVRTVLFNYLFAKHNNGDFILRIEDTDQTRFVEGAEKYIYDTLEWCGLMPDESPLHGGKFAPYKQSERKAIYRQYAEQLVKNGYAYYAFDTAQELELIRTNTPNFQYNHSNRMNMKNSLVLDDAATNQLLANNTPYVIRIKIPENEDIGLNDMIRGEIHFNTSIVDDKVLLKADGMPTYHLAVVVDDFLMEISHAFRGEEWLPSAPVHVLLWKYLFGLNNMPQWAHLPLILKPDGNGKLSKRDGDRLGFPVFAMDWKDEKNNAITTGFKERGFLPQAFINMLVMLGWNDGTEQEIFSLKELIEKFTIERVHKGGAKFDFEKAKWFNHEWIKKLDVDNLRPLFLNVLNLKIEDYTIDYINKVIALVKDRCTYITDFEQQAQYFFKTPAYSELDTIKVKWDNKKQQFFEHYLKWLENTSEWNTATLEENFKNLSSQLELKTGDVMLPFRIMLVGGKFGPAIFDIAHLLEKEETIKRIKMVLNLLQ